jgi:hypothetical protein
MKSQSRYKPVVAGEAALGDFWHNEKLHEMQEVG